MRNSMSYRALAALLLGGSLLGACNGNADNTTTSTPSSMLGTDSAATKVGGTPPAADSSATGRPMAPPPITNDTSSPGH
ncbi:hypothetical protein GO988_17755 [Hymenobacter sp. HMF4947]|uniref:Coproporphyrinogen III oxidase n=1 Tax=Hymenobacter ginkgonis TaxID=2682976 RepID=A0A7K1TID8_9BACT|nr:hypothetical protein [Hymenobacter ginkgonis]MVN78177.1 hypothetical protein [Hymenobacter ginkgonis]